MGPHPDYPLPPPGAMPAVADSKWASAALITAVNTLNALGYVYRGGPRWTPPPDLDAASAEAQATLIENLRGECTKGLNDRARLDWMQSMWASSLHVEVCAAQGTAHAQVEPKVKVFVGNIETEGDTVREAIDAAREAWKVQRDARRAERVRSRDE